MTDNRILTLQSRIHQPFYLIAGTLGCLVTIPLSLITLGMIQEFSVHDILSLGFSIFISFMVVVMFLWGCYGIKKGLTKKDSMT